MAPPTRRDRTSICGITFSSAWWKIATGSCRDFFSMMSNAPYTIDSATDFLPSRMTLFMNFETTMSPNFGSGLISRFSAL